MRWRASKPLDLVHIDICGPLKLMSNGKNWYFLTSIDDFSRKTWINFLKRKSDVFNVFNVFKKFKALVEKQSGYQLKVLRFDRDESILLISLKIIVRSMRLCI